MRLQPRFLRSASVSADMPSWAEGVGLSLSRGSTLLEIWRITRPNLASEVEGSGWPVEASKEVILILASSAITN